MRWGAGLGGDEQGSRDTRLAEVEALISPILRAGAHLGSFCARDLGQEQHPEEIA
jgi:hypothetical protein